MILVVEDDEFTRELYKIFLPDEELIVTENGILGLHEFSLRQMSIEMVLTDFRMPKMNGSDMASNIKEIDPKIKIVMISSEVDMSIPKAVDVMIPKSDLKSIKSHLRCIRQGSKRCGEYGRLCMR